ncbi:MAG: heavy metal-binding domain-containing protein, partial [Polyangiaceae bacterium]
MPPRPQRPAIRLDQSLARVKKGGIPLRAEERLAEEKGAHARLFTSDLSVSAFLLGRRAGCEPIAQVMGSSVFHVGRISDYRGQTGEVKTISDAHRHSRRAALDRLQQEAALVDADAVVGVQIRDRMITMGNRGKGGDAGGEILEFTVIGTAVKAPWIAHPPGKPVLTDLSGQDLWALHQDGFQPCGFVFEFCRYHVWHVLNSPDLDPEFSSRLQREGGATGELRISLLWNNTNDLDLHVVTPSGEEISFSHKKSQCGGLLDVDMNVSSPSSKPIENVFWAHGSAPRGNYTVWVKQYSVRADQNSTPFRIEIVAGGKVSHYSGTVTGDGTRETACTYSYAGPTPMEIP